MKRTDGEDPLKYPIQTPMIGSIYIHVPFCKKKCPYCSFYVVRSKSNGITLYTDALIQEIKLKKQALGKPISLYFGGGTPTQLPLRNLEKILSLFDLSGEITLEANPEDLTQSRLLAYRKMGFNRLSIGAQSFNNDELITLGRNHNYTQTYNCILWAKKAGFTNISLDLMIDLPQQTRKSLEKSLAIIEQLDVAHISLYNLQIEQNSLFWAIKQKLCLPSESLSLQLYQDAIARIEAMGFRRYEISAFCKEDKESIHNTGYWKGRNFIGFGPGAFSCINNHRTRNIRNLRKWCEGIEKKKSLYDFDETLAKEAQTRQDLVIALRMLEGINLKKHQFSPSLLHDIQKQKKEGYLQQDKENLKLSPKGILFYDTLAANLI